MRKLPRTKKETELYNYIVDYYEKNEYMPTMREMSKHFKIKHVQSIGFRLSNLIKKGWLEKVDKCARGLIIIED